jgi:hypothetical protein
MALKEADDRWFRDKVVAPVVVGAVLAVVSLIFARLGWSRYQENKPTDESTTALALTTSGPSVIPPTPTFPGTPAALFLSRDSGPGGTVVRLSGEGFAAGERVTFRFHTEQVGVSRANDAGRFSDVSVTVPESMTWAAPQQFDFIVTGAQSIKSATAPFMLTR